MVLVKQFRAIIPARPTADTCHAINSYVHPAFPYLVKTNWRCWNKCIRLAFLQVHLPPEMNKFQPSRKTSKQTPSSSEVEWHQSRVDNTRTGFQEERSGVKGFEDRVLGNSRLAVWRWSERTPILIWVKIISDPIYVSEKIRFWNELMYRCRIIIHPVHSRTSY